jgi:hypothetical protein
MYLDDVWFLCFVKFIIMQGQSQPELSVFYRQPRPQYFLTNETKL